LDYGGFGGRLSFLPTQNIALFGALGYNLNGAGFNAGAQYRFSPDKPICPTLGAFYGYNAVIVVQGAEQHDKTYYGPNFSFGLEFKAKRKPKNFSTIELIIPLRSDQYSKDFKALEDDPSIEIKSKPLPITISFGYHFGF